MKSLKGKLVKIKWLDHCSYDEARWRKLEEYSDGLVPYPVETVGWVIKDHKDCYVLCSTISFEGQKGIGDMCILKGTVKKVKVLT